jgi:hypothetical protein
MLLKTFPEAARDRTRFELTPLYPLLDLNIQNTTFGVVEALVDGYPKALTIRPPDVCTPFHIACAQQIIPTSNWAIAGSGSSST